MFVMIRTVCVYCASSSLCKKEYFEAAEELGLKLSKTDRKIIYGGGKFGLMGSLADTALANSGDVLGIIPEFMHEQGWCHEELTEVKITNDLQQRTFQMLTGSDAIVALPGGCGTFHELLEAITWKRLALHTKPVIILNINDYYSPLIEQMERSIEEKFMDNIHGQMWTVSNSVDEIMAVLENPPEWSENAIEFANITK
ncbi:MAG: TIGR00730 family Rossman fold protein [bacterium]|nr:TIGR00730 family Rossman fold protein [bacterium]